MYSFLPFLISILFSFCSIGQAIVPKSKTFSFLIENKWNGVLAESQVSYIDVGLSTHPFSLCLYGPETYLESDVIDITLALRLDTRLVWEANRGKPVHKNSTLRFGSDGNLVLAEANEHLVWQTNTANKGVVDLKLLPNGNMVLLDKRGSFIWQSFDHPSDTILVGQSLYPGDQNKLVSRISASDNRNGPYSLVMDGGRLILYYKNKNSPKPEIYSHIESLTSSPAENSTLVRMTLESGPMDRDPYFFFIRLNFTSTDSTTYSVIPAGVQLKFNTTYSLLHLGMDGNFRFYTYSDQVPYTFIITPWDETFALFSRKQFAESECQLPEKCGEFGVCEDNQCVGCPSPKGLLGWSKRCRLPMLPSCNGGSNVDYYKIVGIDHFSSNFSGNGPMKLVDCREKCSKDCKCKGFFYRKDTLNCLVTSQLNTLTRVTTSTHLAFIKMAN